MPIRETLTAKPVTLAEVLSNGKRYVVPEFQRDYAWDEAEWGELWADLVEVHRAPADANHYLGALVLQPSPDGRGSRIIDGQQRLVTLSLLALAIIGQIERLAVAGQDPEDNRERIRLLREKFVSTKDSASLQHSSRLRLNQHDHPFYATYLLQGQTPSRPASLKGSESRLYRAFLYFDRAIQGLLGEATGPDLARFLDGTVASKLRFIEIVVEDDETAFTVFETLNSRGVALGTADLLKNFLFAVAAKGGADDLEQARLWWDRIVGLVPLDQVATFLFHKLSTRVPDMREKRVFSEVKATVARGTSVFALLRDLHESAEIYAALDDPTGEFWAAYPEARPHVQTLEILRVEQCRPVILAALPRFAERPDRLARLLWNLVVISLRASVGRVNTGDLQRAYQSAALRIERGELSSPRKIATALASVTPSDDDFKAAFTQLQLDPKGPRKRLVRYLLSMLEHHAGGAPVDFDGTDATVEHVLPENPSGDWSTAFSAEDRQRDARRLGNLTPLEFLLNKSLGSASFDRKRETYASSRFALTRGIVQSEWTPAAIRARQAVMAAAAVQIWRIEDDV